MFSVDYKNLKFAVTRDKLECGYSDLQYAATTCTVPRHSVDLPTFNWPNLLLNECRAQVEQKLDESTICIGVLKAYLQVAGCPSFPTNLSLAQREIKPTNSLF